MILYINTKEQNRVTVALKKDGEEVDSMIEEREYGSQVLLPMIEKILEKQNIAFKDLEKIEVETGPGSFTGLRVGVSVANALGFSLGIPVNGKKTETQITY